MLSLTRIGAGVTVLAVAALAVAGCSDSSPTAAPSLGTPSASVPGTLVTGPASEQTCTQIVKELDQVSGIGSQLTTMLAGGDTAKALTQVAVAKDGANNVLSTIPGLPTQTRVVYLGTFDQLAGILKANAGKKLPADQMQKVLAPLFTQAQDPKFMAAQQQVTDALTKMCPQLNAPASSPAVK